MKTDHKPLLWKLDERCRNTQTSQQISIAPASDDDNWGWINIVGAQAERHANFILAACNNYERVKAERDELATALNRLTTHFEDEVISSEDVLDALYQARAALAKIESEK
jgi:hypothetical protein